MQSSRARGIPTSSGSAGAPPHPGERATDVDIENFARAVRDIGDRLVSRAVWHGKRCAWTADQMEPVDGAWALVHGSVDGTLYSGTAGIARFLLYLWRATGFTGYRDTALGALERSWTLAESTGDEQFAGLFTGPLGTACVTVEAGRLLARDDLVGRGLEVGCRLADQLARSSQYATFDLIDGLAGILVGFAFLARADPSGRLADAILPLARSLVAAANRSPYGLSWSDAKAGATALCGLGHGASGAALGLLESWRVTGDASLREAAREALRFEKAWFDPNRGTWPDNRDSETGTPQEPAYAPYWCHGSAGIGLVRLRGFQLTGDVAMLAEAGAALFTAVTRVRQLALLMPSDGVATLPDENHSVCHGLGSTIELLTVASEALSNPLFLQHARRAGRVALSMVERNHGRWHCGVQGGDEHPSLMLGLAGIGINYLRLRSTGLAPPASMFCHDSLLSKTAYDVGSSKGVGCR